MKPKVILDIAYLGYAHDEKTSRRGVQRAASHLFEGLLAADFCELTFVAISNLAGAYDFLESHAINPEERLYFQRTRLLRSRLARKLVREVHRIIEDRSLSARCRRRFLTTIAAGCLHNQSKLSSSWLDDADIYHSPQMPFTPEVNRHPRLRRIITVHDFMPLKSPELFPNGRNIMDALLVSLQSRTVALCSSEATRQDLLHFSRLPPEQALVTPLAADPKIFYPVVEPGPLLAVRNIYQLGDAPYFLALSALDRHKNFSHLIECFGALAEAGELGGERLVIVGPNPGRNPEIRQVMAQFPSLKERIIIPGYVPDADLAAIYSGATAFLFPSLMEGFGLPPLEAMQCGTPVIASNTTSTPEVVGDAGILLPPTDRDAWCQAMLNLSRQSSLRAELREKSLQRSKLFSWQRFMDETLRGYKISLALK